jgi:hypothetical protein
MADTKISELTELDEIPAGGDLFAIVDVSAGVTKKITRDNLVGGLGGSPTVITHTSDFLQIDPATTHPDGSIIHIDIESIFGSATVKLPTIADQPSVGYKIVIFVAGWGGMSPFEPLSLVLQRADASNPASMTWKGRMELQYLGDNLWTASPCETPSGAGGSIVENIDP